MVPFNIEILKSFPKELDNQKINDIFVNLLKEIENYLKLEVITSEIEIVSSQQKSNVEIKRNNILDFGVKRYYQNGILIIEILEEFEKYFPVIYLREAYYCFVPNKLKDNDGIKIIINQIIEINLEKFEIINEWSQLVKKYIIDYDFLSTEFDRLEKFLKLEESNNFFFDYIRRNVNIIDENMENFHDNLIKNFILKTSKYLFDNEMVETLRILTKIFYKVKSYKALLEYKNYFKNFKKSGEIKTEISLRKFSENVKWINKFTNIAPSYLIYWKSINVGAVYCKLCFNPLLDKAQIDLIIENLPFFIWPKSSESSFAVEVTGWFMLPLIYQKDLSNFLEKLELYGYLVKKKCFLYDTTGNFLNLNYFREFYRKGRIINPEHFQYDKKYEIDFKIDFNQYIDVIKLSILDYLIINRLPYWSTDGFSFERRTETLRTIKSDLFNEILSQTRLIRKLKKNIEIVHSDSELKNKFLQFLNRNQNFGFFYIKELLENLKISLKLTKTILSKNPDIKSAYQFQEFVDKTDITLKLDDNIIFNKNNIKKIIYQDLLPIYFQNRKEFNKEFNNYRIFTRVFASCYRIKIFDLKAITRIIEDKTIVKRIYSVKEQKLRKILQEYKLQNITSNNIDDIIDSFVDEKSSVIKPFLIGTINTTNFAKYFIEIILKDNYRTRKIIDNIKKYFPRFSSDSGVDLFSNEKLRLISIYLPNINKNEKKMFLSILFNLFKDNLISIKRYFYDGFFKSITLKDFYDLDKQEFFYTGDLFEQYFIYVQKVFGNELKTFEESITNRQKSFWSLEKSLNNLVKKVNDRVSREQIIFNIDKLSELLNFHLNLKKILLSPIKFKEINKKDFFKEYIKSIKFIPVFQNFGLGQYYLYIRPISMDTIDFKLLFNNTFQKVRYPAYIDNIQPIFIKSLFPYRNLNQSYLNWLIKSKKIISEYCSFFIKKIYILFHFDYNISSNGWEIDSNRFKAYIQKVLFEPNFKFVTSKTKEYNIGALSKSDYLSPDSPYFKSLTQIHSWKSIDLKSVMGTKNISLVAKISDLISNELIIPYINLKNLGFQEKIEIILPSLKIETVKIIINIFKFFNYGFLYEIEGEYFINGFSEQIKFENGLYIKIHLPLSEISDFKRIFDLIFRFLKIKKYVILNDMVSGNHIIKSVYGNLDFLKEYNPLNNLRWNEKDKIFMNHKLFNEKFEPIYPKMI